MTLQAMPEPPSDYSLGKTVHQRLYLHATALDLAPPSTQDLLAQASRLASASTSAFNVVRFDPAEHSVALLNYPDFFDEPFPALEQSWKVALGPGQVSYRTYADSLNPPILHRKELLLPPDHPDRSKFAKLTSALESLGFFDDPVRIGFRVQWDKLLQERGFRVTGHSLVPIGNEEPADFGDACAPGEFEVARHLTALTRHSFSAPIQLLDRLGFLADGATLFDYGCGKGHDVRGLVENGVAASGWDPFYAPAVPVLPANIVNLGFVINVIEDPVERRDALMRAYALAQDALIVSTMIASEDATRGRPFADGVLTGRNTFQKYYTQNELREYLVNVLGEEPVPVAPGIFLVFRNKEAEQRFEVARYRSAIRLRQLTRVPRERPTLLPRAEKLPRPDRYAVHQALLGPLWYRCLELGREPDPTEVPNLAEIESALGSLRRALALTFSHHDSAELEQAQRQRSEDLLVMLALRLFQKRRPYKHLEAALQRDIKAFFRDYTSALDQARNLLHQVAKPQLLEAACQLASDQGLGWLEPGHSLQLHTSSLPRLPSLLRVYVGCAGVLYGDLAQADLIKIHISSGKVSLMNFDNFLGSPLPRMLKRVKVNLRSQEMQLFLYGDEFPAPLLYLKSRLMNEETHGYAEQLAFDEQLQSLGLVDLSGFGPSPDEFADALHIAHWKVDGCRMARIHYIPPLDQRCGSFLTYRDFIECGRRAPWPGRVEEEMESDPIFIRSDPIDPIFVDEPSLL